MAIKKLLNHRFAAPLIAGVVGSLVIGWVGMRVFAFEFFNQPSGSMEPTVKVDDYFWVSKWGYGNYEFLGVPILKGAESRHPLRGEIFVFRPPHDARYFVKRVVGLPGDQIEMRNNMLFVNDKKIDHQPIENQNEESDHDFEVVEETLGKNIYLIKKKLNFRDKHRAYGKWNVPEGYYFMMGDNRDDSADSRYWGPVPRENFVGKVVLQ